MSPTFFPSWTWQSRRRAKFSLISGRAQERQLWRLHAGSRSFRRRAPTRAFGAYSIGELFVLLPYPANTSNLTSTYEFHSHEGDMVESYCSSFQVQSHMQARHRPRVAKPFLTHCEIVSCATLLKLDAFRPFFCSSVSCILSVPWDRAC